MVAQLGWHIKASCACAQTPLWFQKSLSIMNCIVQDTVQN